MVTKPVPNAVLAVVAMAAGILGDHNAGASSEFYQLAGAGASPIRFVRSLGRGGFPSQRVLRDDRGRPRLDRPRGLRRDRTFLAGVDALLPMIDTSDRTTQQEYGLAQTSSRAIDKDESLLTVTRLEDGKEETLSYPFRPGSLAWRSDQYVQRTVDPLLGFLDWLANPLPRSWQADLGRGAQLEVLGYYPHARRERYSPAEASDKKTFPAVKFGLSSQFAPMMGERWVAYGTGDHEARLGPAVVARSATDIPESNGRRCHAAAIAELDLTVALAEVAARRRGERYWRTGASCARCRGAGCART